MYANKLAVAVKHRGKVLQEFGEVVYLPFGSEYGLLIKNLNTVRASVKVSIDGRDATEGVNLVVPPNSSIDLERFIKNGNLSAGNRFRFIERNAAVEAHRGIGIDDGVIRVTWSFEMPPVQWQPPPQSWIKPPDWTTFGGIAGSSGPFYNSSSSTANATNISGATLTSTVNTRRVTDGKSKSAEAAGVTAPGSVSNQQFTSVGWFQTEAVQHSIVLQLSGQSANVGNIQKVVYTRTKVACTMCGYASKSTAAFCSQCGTSLNIIG